jgi:hypothetical protein
MPSLRSILAVLSVTALATLAVPAAAADAVSDLEQLMIESADTPEAHAALADYFKKKADGMRAEAERHRRMGKSYGGQDRIARASELKSHCDELARLNENIAEQYDGLSALHRDESTQHR